MSFTQGKCNAPLGSDLVEAALCNLKGQVSVVKDLYGFITIEHPIHATVFAHWSTIINPRMHNGRKFSPKEGDKVVLDIKKSPPKFKARYQAVRVRLLKSEVGIKQFRYPTLSATHQETKKISNQEGKIDSVHQNGGTVTFGKGNEERATFDRRCIPHTLVRPEEKVCDIFSVGTKVCFDACLMTDSATGTTQWQATRVTTVMKEKFSKVFDIDLVAPVSGRHSTKSNPSTVPIMVPFTSDSRLPLYPSSWNPASSAFQAYRSRIVTTASFTAGKESSLSDVYGEHRNMDQTLNSRHTSMPSLTMAMKSTKEVTDRHSVKDKPAVVPLGSETRRARSDGFSSTEPNTTAPADGRPLPASHYQPLKAKSPKRAFTESALFTINPHDIGPATSTAGKQLAPQASNITPTTSVQKQLAAALPSKPEAGSQYDAVQQKELNVDSTSVNNSGKDNTVRRNSASAAPHVQSPKCLVSVHDDVRGVVMRVHERCAIVGVKHGGLADYTEVQAFSFYKDGTLVKDDLRHVLRVGDEVTVDFMSGSTGCNLMMHCNMFWQGVKPQGVECVSRESFQSTLEALMAMEVPPPGASIQSSNPNVSSMENSSRTIKPEQPCLEVVKSCDTDDVACRQHAFSRVPEVGLLLQASCLPFKHPLRAHQKTKICGVCDNQEELAKATAKFVVKCLRDVVHEEVQALIRELSGDMGVSTEGLNTSSDSPGASTAAPPPGRPQIRSDESHHSAAEARQLEIQDLHEGDLKIISSLISEGIDAILTELRRLRRHPGSLVDTIRDRSGLSGHRLANVGPFNMQLQGSHDGRKKDLEPGSK